MNTTLFIIIIIIIIDIELQESTNSNHCCGSVWQLIGQWAAAHLH